MPARSHITPRSVLDASVALSLAWLYWAACGPLARERWRCDCPNAVHLRLIDACLIWRWVGAGALGAVVTARWRDPVYRGTVWTTDAPYRETAAGIAEFSREGVLAVEMEAASLHALARARGYPTLCFAHVTNRMAVQEGDFEKGEAGGALLSLELVGTVGGAWLG